MGVFWKLLDVTRVPHRVSQRVFRLGKNCCSEHFFAILHTSLAAITRKLPESKPRLARRQMLTEALKYTRVRSITLTNFIIHESIIHVTHNSKWGAISRLKVPLWSLNVTTYNANMIPVARLNICCLIDVLKVFDVFGMIGNIFLQIEIIGFCTGNLKSIVNSVTDCTFKAVMFSEK